MQERIANAKHHGSLARENALLCSERYIADEWLRVARMWEELAHECGEFEKEKRLATRAA